MKTFQAIALACGFAAIAGCASGPTQSPPAPIITSSDKPGAAENAVGQAVTTPLSDLNLVQAPIPAALKEAHKAPYAQPLDTSCEQLALQVQALDEVLGTDLDVPPTPSNPGLVERGSREVGNAAAGALKSAAEGIVPFRGWVRKLSGAERYSKEVAAAIAAGTVRRAYLKGLGEARGCAAPAAPQHHEPKA
jgi:hypothetical protein